MVAHPGIFLFYFILPSQVSIKFSFFLASCHTTLKEPSLSNYFIPSWRENNWIYAFPKGTSEQTWLRFELGPPYPTTVIITLRVPQKIYGKYKNGNGDSIKTKIQYCGPKKLKKINPQKINPQKDTSLQ